MRIATLCLLFLLACSAGCYKKRPKPTSPKEPDLVQRISGKVKETVTAFEMKDLHLFIEYASSGTGQMPNNDVIVEYTKKENPKLGKLLDDGTIILTGTKVRESVWAYEKDSETKGGWVITNIGPQKMTAEEFKQRMGK